MSETTVSTIKVRIGPRGRVFLPDSIRERMGVSEGDEISLVLDEEGVHLRTHEQAIRAIQRLFREYVPPRVSLVDELIADRRAEAAREAEE